MFSYKINDEKYKMQVKENIQEIPEVVNNEIINNVEIETKKIKDNESSGVSTNTSTLSSNASEATVIYSGLFSNITNPYEKPFDIKFPKANKYQVLIYIKVIGEHKEKNKRNNGRILKNNRTT